MKQLKDIEIKTKIVLTQIKERFKDGDCIEYKDKLICISIDKNNWTHSTCFKDNKTGRKQLLNYIKRECYLK